MVQLRSQIFRQMKQKFLAAAALQLRIFVKYDEKMPGKCATRALRGEALNLRNGIPPSAANEGAFRALRSAASAARRWTRAASPKAVENFEKRTG